MINMCSIYFLATKLELVNITTSEAVMTGGLVQEYKHSILPSVPPIVTLAATVLSILVSLQCGILPWGG